MAIHFSPAPSPITSNPLSPAAAPSIFPTAEIAQPMLSRRRSARLSMPLPSFQVSFEPHTSTSAPVPPVASTSTIFQPPSPQSTKPLVPAPSRNLRKRSRPSDSDSLQRQFASPQPQAKKSQSPSQEGRERLTRSRMKSTDKILERVSEKKRRRLSAPAPEIQSQQPEDGVSDEDTSRRLRTRSTTVSKTVESPSLVPGSAPSVTPTRPNHRKRKSMSALDDFRRSQGTGLGQLEQTPKTGKRLRKSADAEDVGAREAIVTFLLDDKHQSTVKGKGKEKETSPGRGPRSSRYLRSSTTAAGPFAGAQDIPMGEPIEVNPPVQKRRRSKRRVAPVLQTRFAPESHVTPPATPPSSSPELTPRQPPTPLGAAAAILALSSHSATLPPSALSPPGSPTLIHGAVTRRFTRSSLIALNTQQSSVYEPHSPMTSPLSPTSPLSSPPGSPLSTTSSLSTPLSPNQVASAQTQSKAPAKLASTNAPSIRRIATRSSGLPLVEGDLLTGAARKRSPLAFASESASTAPPDNSSLNAARPVQGKGRGKAGRSRSGLAPRPSRRSSRLSGLSGEIPVSDISSVDPSTSTNPEASPSSLGPPSSPRSQPPSPTPSILQNSSTPPLSPPSPPPLRLSLSSLPAPAPSTQRKPHTRSPLSGATSSSGGPVLHSSAGSLPSPLKDGSTPQKEGSGTSTLPNHQLPSGNKTSTQNQSHTPPGSPTRSPSSQMEIDAVDFGTMPMMLPGPSLALSQVGVFGSGAQTSPPSQLQLQVQAGQGPSRKERARSPTSPTERRAPLAPLIPSTLLAAAAAAAAAATSLPSSSSSAGSSSGSNSNALDRAGAVKAAEKPSLSENADNDQVRNVGKEKILGDSGRLEKEPQQQKTVAVSIDEGYAPPALLVSEIQPMSTSSTQPMQDVQENLEQQSQPQPHPPSLYPPLIQVEIPAAPQPERFVEQQLGELPSRVAPSSPPVSAYQREQVEEAPRAQAQYQYVAPPPPPPSYTWEEPPRLDNERNLWRLACKVRVWDLRRRYSLETIRSLVTHEAHEYYVKNGFPTGFFSSSSYPSSGYGSSSGMSLRSMGGAGPSRLRAQGLSRQPSGGSTSSEGESPTSPLNFMDEPVYDWEIATSDEDDVEEYDDDDDDEDYEEYEEEEEDEEDEEEGVTSGMDARGEEGDEEARRQRQQRRTSLLRHLRKPSGDSDDLSLPAESPSTAADDGANGHVNVNGAPAGDGEPEAMDVDVDMDIEDLDDALDDPNFNIELSSCTSASGSPTSPQQMSPSSPSSAVSPSSGQANGVFTSFYVPPVQQISVQQVFAPQPMQAQDSSSSALSAALGTPPAGPVSPLTSPVSPSSPSPTSEVVPSLLIDTLATPPTSSSAAPPLAATPPTIHLPLQTISIPLHVPSPTPPIMDLPPPRLSSVPVWALRNMEMSGGSMGKGTPVNRERALEWAQAWRMDPARSRAVSLIRSESLRRSVSADATGFAAVVGVLGDGEARGVGMPLKEEDFRMEVVREGRNKSGEDRKPKLRLSLPGEEDMVGLMPALGPAGVGGTAESAAPGNASGSVVGLARGPGQVQILSSAVIPSGSGAMPSLSGKQSMFMDSAFEPSNQADWDAFLASLAAPPSNASNPSSLAMMGGQQGSSHHGMGNLEHDHRAPPPPYSSLHPNIQHSHSHSHSPPPTPIPPSPASSTCSLSQDNAGVGNPGHSIHSPGTSTGQGNGGGMFGMMNVNMMFGVGGGQNNAGSYTQQQHQGGQGQPQPLMQQGVGNDGSQPCFPAMGLTMSMPQSMGINNAQPSMNSMQPPYSNAMSTSFNSMSAFNMGMGMGMNPTMNMNVPLNMGMGMGMPMMQMPMSMPFAGLQLGVTLSLAPQQHSHQQHQHQHQQQGRAQPHWGGNGNGAQGNGGGMDFDLAGFGNVGMGQGGAEGMNMFSLVNTATPTNTPLNSPMSPSSASIPSSMLGVMGAGLAPSNNGENENEKGNGGATPSTLSFALG